MTQWNFGYGLDDRIYTSAPPKWLAGVHPSILKDIPANCDEAMLAELSAGDVTWGDKVIGASDLNPSGWLIFDNLTITGVVTWRAPILRLIVLNTLTISGSGKLSGGAQNGSNGASNLSGKGGDSMLATGAAGISTSGAGNLGSFGAGSSGVLLPSGGTQAPVTSGGTTAAVNWIRELLPGNSLFNFYDFGGTGIRFKTLSTVLSLLVASGGGGSSAVGASAGGGGGASAMSLFLLAKVFANGGSGIELKGGNGGNAYGDANGGSGGHGGQLVVISTSAANGTRNLSGGTVGSGKNSDWTSAGSSGTEIWEVSTFTS